LQAGPIETHKVAILAALSIADEYFQARDGLARQRVELGERVEGIAEKLEASLAD
jgi:cell division protein ZapA (FtsZ GTPase activity inhibitor)